MGKFSQLTFHLKTGLHSLRYSTFYKHTQWDAQRTLVWTLHAACKSVDFDRGYVFLSSVGKQVVKTLKRLKGILVKYSIYITLLLNLQSTSL